MGFRIKLAKHVSIGKSGARVGGKIAPGTYVSTGSSGTYVGAKSGPVLYNKFIRNQPAKPKSAGRRVVSTDDEARTQPIPTAADPGQTAPTTAQPTLQFAPPEPPVQPPVSGSGHGPSTGGPGGTHRPSQTGWLLSGFGLLIAIIGAMRFGVGGFFGAGLLWFSVCVAFSLIAKRTAWLTYLPRAVA